jgi:hypothetical protein
MRIATPLLCLAAASVVALGCATAPQDPFHVAQCPTGTERRSESLDEGQRFSCVDSRGDPQGPQWGVTPAGTLFFLAYFRDGQMDGVATIWSAAGHVYSEAEFDRGQPVWMTIRHDSGALAERWTYAEDDTAWVEEWYRTGARRASGRYANRTKIGIWSFWTRGGSHRTRSYAKLPSLVAE